jgi:adenosylcobyric acid synthase
MTARAIMILGTTSGAGKSWLTTALCRWYARQGLKVAPFKAQNMSNNARVVPGLQGQLGEIGSAQYFQALAARVQPDVRMNPVLLKPERDTASQVIVMGQVRPDFTTMPWRQRSNALWPHAQQALQQLQAEFDVVVMEGAGSPAEINLHDCDFVNMRSALAAQAACLIVTDIDRGGAFAHLFGTHQLLQPAEQALIKGFVLNRFRGDPALLAPGPEQLQALTGVPTVGVIPMWRDHGLPEEDGWFDNGQAWSAPSAQGAAEPTCRIAIVAYPRISNLDEFQPLRQVPHARVRWARSPADLEGADWVILPGSKHTTGDLAWMRERGLDLAVLQHAQAGRPVLGICGGLQMLGRRLLDPHQIEGQVPEVAGLGLLDLQTEFDPHKWLAPVSGHFASNMVAWSALSGQGFQGYEIHHGRTSPFALPGGHAAQPAVFNAQGQVLGWQQGSVLGLYAHGLLEDAGIMHALFGQTVRSLDDVFDGLADVVDEHLGRAALTALLNP